MIHIAHDEIDMENKNYPKRRSDIVVNGIVAIGFRLIEKIYRIIRHS
jgi:hypothetical protein